MFKQKWIIIVDTGERLEPGLSLRARDLVVGGTKVVRSDRHVPSIKAYLFNYRDTKSFLIQRICKQQSDSYGSKWHVCKYGDSVRFQCFGKRRICRRPGAKTREIDSVGAGKQELESSRLVITAVVIFVVAVAREDG